MTPDDRPNEAALPAAKRLPAAQPTGMTGDEEDSSPPAAHEAGPTINPVTGQPSVGDYVRDLQLEYEEEQEEGKV
jgi:hypothetical protein